LYLHELEGIFKRHGLKLPQKLLKQIQIDIMELLNKKNYDKALLFKNGLLATAVVLKDYNSVKFGFIEAFLTSYATGQPPVFHFKWNFKEYTTCMKLDNSMCKIDGAFCRYAKQRKFPLCEYVHKSIEEALENG